MKAFNAINRSLGVDYVPHHTDNIDDVEEYRQNASEPSTSPSNVVVAPRVATPLEIVPTASISDLSEDIQDDYDTSRTALRELIQKGTDSMDIIIQLAETSESPRAYEVATTMMNTIASLSKTLMDVHKTVKNFSPKAEAPKPVVGDGSTVIQNQQNIVFSGTGADLTKFLQSEDGDVIDV